MHCPFLLSTAALAGAFALGCADQQQPPTAPAGEHAPALAPTPAGTGPQFAAGRGTPTRVPITDEQQRFDIPAGVDCNFELAGEPVENNEVLTIFPARPNGDVVWLITGRLVERLTNVETGKSITVKASGPVRFTFHPDGSITTELGGRSIAVLFPGHGGPSTFLNAGRAVFTFRPGDTGGTLVILRGHQQDLCAALS